MSAHTPGPWEAVDGGCCIEGAPDKKGLTPWIANCDSHGANDKDEDRANGRLIAAAPDLLAALQTAERALAKAGCDFAASSARVAIAKAGAA